RGGIADVAIERQRIVRLFKGRDRAAEQLAFDVEQRHPPAIGEKTFGGRKSDAARGSRDKGDFWRGSGHQRSIVIISNPSMAARGLLLLRGRTLTRGICHEYPRSCQLPG